jgi:hypothetical protein
MLGSAACHLKKLATQALLFARKHLHRSCRSSVTATILASSMFGRAATNQPILTGGVHVDLAKPGK